MSALRSLEVDMLPTLTGMGDWAPILDDDAILDGSNAVWGYRMGNCTGEVFFYGPTHQGESSVLEIYDHDGRNRPTRIEVLHFGYTDAEILFAIKLSLQHKNDDTWLSDV